MAELYLNNKSSAHISRIPHPSAKAAFCIIENGIVNSKKPPGTFGRTAYKKSETKKLFKCLIALSKVYKLKKTVRYYKKQYRDFRKEFSNGVQNKE